MSPLGSSCQASRQDRKAPLGREKCQLTKGGQTAIIYGGQQDLYTQWVCRHIWSYFSSIYCMWTMAATQPCLRSDNGSEFQESGCGLCPWEQR